MNKIITPEHSTYQINKQLTIRVWNDKTFSILLPEDTVDLTPSEVKDLHRITSQYKATHETIWEQEQYQSDCLKCKHIQKVPQQQTGLPVTTTYLCLKNKYEDKMAHPNYYCDTYEERRKTE